MRKSTLELLLEGNRNRLVAISELEIIVTSRKQRNGGTALLEKSLEIEEELYELDLRAIKTLREDIKI